MTPPNTSGPTRPDLNRTLTAEENATNAIDLLVNGSPFGTIINEEGDDVTDEMRAYAALFVAAPDMLAALKDSLDVMNGWLKFPPPGAEPSMFLRTTIIKTEKAIAKAEATQ